MLYVDYIFILCTGKMPNIQSLKKIFQYYFEALGQNFNIAKYFIYYGSITDSHLNRIIAYNDLIKLSLPFKYLGVPIFKVRVKYTHLTLTSDKISAKLSA